MPATDARNAIRLPTADGHAARARSSTDILSVSFNFAKELDARSMRTESNFNTGSCSCPGDVELKFPALVLVERGRDLADLVRVPPRVAGDNGEQLRAVHQAKSRMFGGELIK